MYQYNACIWLLSILYILEEAQDRRFSSIQIDQSDHASPSLGFNTHASRSLCSNLRFVPRKFQINYPLSLAFGDDLGELQACVKSFLNIPANDRETADGDHEGAMFRTRWSLQRLSLACTPYSGQ